MTTYNDVLKQILERNNITGPSKGIEIKPENPKAIKEIVWFDPVNKYILVSSCGQYDSTNPEDYLNRAVILKPLRYKEVLRQVENKLD